MTISLNRYAQGVSDYINKMNSDADVLEAAINALQAQMTGASGGVLDVPNGLQWILDRTGIIGEGSYDFPVGSGSTITVGAGAYWNGVKLYFKKTATNLSLAGKSAGTYYITLDAAGNPQIASAPDGATTTRQFTWDGTGTTSAKALYSGVAILFSGADYAAMLISAARNKTYQQVADRLADLESPPVQTLAEAATVTIDWRSGRLAQITLTQATTAFTFTQGVDGQRYILALTQDPTGGRGISFGSEVRVGNMVVVLSGPGKTDYLGFIYRGGPAKFDLVSLAQNY
jgi:hypothetical protein